MFDRNNLDRRQFLRASAATATAAVIAGGAGALGAPSASAAAAQLQFSVVNKTGKYPDSAVRLYIVGTAPDGQQCYVKADGTRVPVTSSLNGPDGFADLSIPLPDGPLPLPKMSGRVYVSLGSKLKFKVVGGNALQYPAGWDSGDPSYDVMHDWMEFTYNSGGMFCNTTMVDMFSVPIALRLNGSSQQTTGALKPGGRDAIFTKVANDPDFAPLVLGNKLRVISPGHGVDVGKFPARYFDPYIDRVWDTYAGTDLHVMANGTRYTGRVSGGKLRFDKGVAPFSKPTTHDVLFCDGALAAPNDGVTGPVAAVLGAAFNRSTLNAYPDQPVTDASKYYQTPRIVHHYSDVMHKNTVDGKAYGFPFDDVTGQAAYIQDTAPTALTMTLTAFA